MRHEAAVGDLDADDDGADADEAVRADDGVVHDGLEADERVVADVAGAVDERVVRDRDVLADVDRPRLAGDHARACP